MRATDGSRCSDEARRPATASRVGRWERGQTLAVIAVMLVVLVGSLAVVIDLGNVFAQRRAMQNAADAAALAAARALALEQGEDAARAAANEYSLTRNGAESCAVSIDADGQGVTVVVSRTTDTYFASMVGVPTMPVPAVARAVYTVPTSWSGDLMPVALQADILTMTGEIRIWDDQFTPTDPSQGLVADGQRGWLNFNGGSLGNNELVDWITNGYDGPVNAGDWVNGDPGTHASALQAMDEIREHTIIIVPIYDTVREGESGSGQLDYHIVAFAAMYVDAVKDTGNPKYIEGHFVEYVGGSGGGGSYDTGVRAVRLVPAP